MIVAPNIKKKYKEIQNQLFYMIPEKWNRIYLYASVVERANGLQTGEMYFYYIPKGVLKKNPVSVYEIPSRFNLEENEYLELVDKLYDTIKSLREECISSGEEKWTNITIIIKDLKFIVKYNYDNLTNSELSSYDRHLIFRCKYLGVPLSNYKKDERNKIEKYILNNDENSNTVTYTEGIYMKPIKNIINYNNVDEEHVKIEEEKYIPNQIKESKELKSQILKY